MKILDWYVFKKFIITYFFTVGIIIAVILVIDYSEKVDNFNQPELTAWIIIRDYYINLVPYFANMLSPLFIFMASVFVTAKLATHTEIVAMLSSGMSLRRVLLPYIWASSLIGVAVFFLINWTIPNANKVRHTFEDKYVRSEFHFTKRNVHIKIAPKVYAYLQSYNNTVHRGYRFTLEKIQDEHGKEKKLISKLESDNIFWNQEKKKWTIQNYKIRTFKNGKESLEYGQVLDTSINLSPKDFETKHLINERLTLTELNREIEKSKMRGADDLETFVIEKYERIAYPFSIVILTVIGVILSSKKSREGTGFQIAIGFILAFVYILLIMLGRTFAKGGSIPTYLAVWIPNLIFAILGFIIYKRVPK